MSHEELRGENRNATIGSNGQESHNVKQKWSILWWKLYYAVQ